MTPEEKNELIGCILEALRLHDLERQSPAAKRQQRYRERLKGRNALRNESVTHNAIPSENVTPLQRNAQKDLFLPNGSLPPTPPITPLPSLSPKKNKYVTHAMIEFWCKKKNCSKMVDSAWGKLMSGRYFGTLIKNEEDFNAAMASIRDEWLKLPE